MQNSQREPGGLFAHTIWKNDETSRAARRKKRLGRDNDRAVRLLSNELDRRRRRIVGTLPVGKHRRIDDRAPIRQLCNPLPHLRHGLPDQVDHIQTVAAMGISSFQFL